MKPKIALKPIQRPMLPWILDHERCALFAPMGSGKTTACLTAANIGLTIHDWRSPLLVIAPMRVARDTWPDDAKRWRQFEHFRIRNMPPDPRRRVELLKLRPLADIYTTSYELLPWLVDYYGDKWPFRTVIADESTRLKGFRTKQGGERAHQIGRVAHTIVKRWVNLTGTPTPNGLKDLWGQQWFIDRGKRLGNSYNAFMKRWFYKDWDGIIKPVPFAFEQITKQIHDTCLTIDLKDYYDFKEPIVTPVRVTLPPKARAVYRELERELFTKLDSGTEVEVFNAAALTNKCLQLANGAIYTAYPNWEAVHDEKIEATKSIIEEAAGASVLIAYEFKSDIARLRAAFPKSMELAKPEGLRAFKEGKCVIGLAHPASMGHGIDGLQNVCNMLIRFGHNWNWEQREQMLQRIGPMRQMQAGFDRPVLVWDIIADDTLDDTVLERHSDKGSLTHAVLQALKR